MPDQKRIWRSIVPVALLLLVLATTFGMICHSHVDCSPSTCPLCHLTIAPSLPGDCAQALILESAGPDLQHPRLIAQFVVPQLPPRAPPA